MVRSVLPALPLPDGRGNQTVCTSVCLCLVQSIKKEENRRIVVADVAVAVEEDGPPNAEGKSCTPSAADGRQRWRKMQRASHTAKTRLIKWKDSPLFKGTHTHPETDQNHTKQQQKRREEEKTICTSYYYNY